jgi:hypothetical protein
MKKRKLAQIKYIYTNTSIVIVRGAEKIGHIKCLNDGYQYKFNGFEKSDTYTTLQACKIEIER